MSERRQQNKFVPLRLRFRSQAEASHWERDKTSSNGESVALEPHVSEATKTSEAKRRTQQIKELLRLSNLLHTEIELSEVLQQIADAMVVCTCFRSMAIYLIEDKNNHLLPVTFAGVSQEHALRLKETPITIEQMKRLMRPEFRISQSYFISHEHAEEFADVVMAVIVETYKPGGWHPHNGFISPLFSSREKRLLGFLTLDDPEDGKLPSIESIEVVELFANQTAIAIDNAQIFQER